MHAPRRGRYGRAMKVWIAVIALVFVGWLVTASQRTALAWSAATGVYGEESYQSHQFRWMDSPAEIVVWSPRDQNTSLEGEWRCGFHSANAVLELSVNGQTVAQMPVSQTIQHVDWPVLHLKKGRNILRWVSSAGHARISVPDARVVAMGVQDLLLRGNDHDRMPQADCLPFFIGAGLLIIIARQIITGLQLREVDALGGGMVGAFAALSLSATVLSFFDTLTGATWIVGLMMIAAILQWSTKRITPGDDAGNTPFPLWQIALILLPALFVAWVQLISPVAKFDDLMYHGSRAGYWLGNHSVFPFPSHNERQEVFPYAGDLLFAFGVFTARNETLGRMMVFLAYPGMLLLIAGLLRKRGVSAGVAIGTAWLVGSTPQVRDAAIGIKPDLWGLVFALIAINEVWNIWHAPHAPGRKTSGAIVLGSICAAIAIKTTFLLLIPLAFVPLLMAGSFKERIQLAGVVAGSLFSFGLLVTFVHNKKYEKGWLGSPEMVRIHRPDPGVGAVRRQLERLPFLLVGIPWVPNETLRNQIEKQLDDLSVLTGAAKPLPLESSQEWPGRFAPTVPEFNRGYSLLWLFGLFGLTAGLLNLKTLMSDRDGVAGLAVIGLGLSLMIGVATAVRWQANSDVPARFLVAGFAVTMVGAAYCWSRAGWRHPAIMLSLASLLAFHAVPFLQATHLFLLQVGRGGIGNGGGTSALSPAAAIIPPRSRILLFASQATGDYVLFHPAAGFLTTVMPWGRRPFSEKAFASVLARDNPDFIVFEGRDSVSFHWHDPVSLAPFLNFLDKSPLFFRVSGGAPNLIYQRHGYVP